MKIRRVQRFVAPGSDVNGLTDYMMVEPLPRMETYGEYDGTKCPVGEHSDPHGNRTEAPYTAQVYTQDNTAEPHGQT